MKYFFCIVLLSLSVVAEAATLKLLTWNIFMIPKPINFSLQVKRAKLIAQELKQKDYDVMFFQEAFSGKARRHITRQLKAQYPYHARLKGKFLKINSGLLVLSKYPLEVLDSLHYKDCTTSDCLSAKGVMLVEVTLPGGERVQIANSHLQAWNTQKAKAVRVKQFTEVKELLARFEDPGIPQLLVGDLNVDGRLTGEYQSALKLLGMESGNLEGPQQVTNGFSVDCYKIPFTEPEGEWLDHVFLNKQETNTTVKNKQVVKFSGFIKNKSCPLSDHYAVEATINL